MICPFITVLQLLEYPPPLSFANKRVYLPQRSTEHKPLGILPPLPPTSNALRQHQSSPDLTG